MTIAIKNKNIEPPYYPNIVFVTIYVINKTVIRIDKRKRNTTK